MFIRRIEIIRTVAFSSLVLMMISPLSFTCLIVILGLSNAWIFPSFVQDEPMTNSTNGLSIFDDFTKHMMAMHQRFEKLFDLSAFDSNHNLETNDEWEKLDAMTPNCTTTSNGPSTSLERTRRKKLRNTQTITCVKEMIIDGKQYIYKETNVTDTKGEFISQSKGYQSFIIKTANNTLPVTGDESLIKY